MSVPIPNRLEEAMAMYDTKTVVGTSLPNIVLPRLDGGVLRFGNLRGKRLLLFFWGSW